MFLLPILYESIMIVAGLYLYILLCKYLRIKIRNSKKPIIISNGNTFLNTDTGKLLLNTKQIKTFYLENCSIYAELLSGELFFIKKSRDEEEARIELDLIKEKCNEKI